MEVECAEGKTVVYLNLVYTHNFLLKKSPDQWEVLFNKFITLWRCQWVHKGGRKKIEGYTHLLTEKAAEKHIHVPFSR